MRINKINQAWPRVNEVYRRDDKHRVFSVKSVNDQKPFQVVLDMTCNNGLLRIEAKLFSFEAKYFQFRHPSNICNKTVCYQVLAAVKWAAKREGKIVSFCFGKDGYRKARRLLNFGGKLVKIGNLGKGVVWATVR